MQVSIKWLKDYIDLKLTPEELAELLELTEEQAGALRAFIMQVGGLDNACEAIDQLDQLAQWPQAA